VEWLKKFAIKVNSWQRFSGKPATDFTPVWVTLIFIAYTGCRRMVADIGINHTGMWTVTAQSELWCVLARA
ncbi:hypothetical protein, partial [Shewanella sp. GXUN23E]|uniref:hypothetical protein n=1 Tax=Shewanella sp. GXUN23E TaxID=3422498 RepID=UPI003D7E966C